MQKLTPSANSQISKPKSIRRFNSIGHSNGEVLMNEYFNLPMISTKSTKEHQGIQRIKPNTISIIRDFEEQNQQHSQENNIIPLQSIISQGEKGDKILNYNFQEKYYQKKVIKRKIEPKRFIRQQQQQENIGEKINANLQTKIAQNFDKSSNSSKYSTERNFQIGQDQFKTISNQNTPQYLFSDLYFVPHHNEKTSEREILTQRIDFQRGKLKIFFLFVFSTMIISKKFRFLKKEDTQIIFQLTNKLESCQRIINQYGAKSIEELQKQFVQVIANKVIHYLKSQTYIDECNKIDKLSNPILNLDLKTIRVQIFSKLIYQNLELLTRENNFPELLKFQMITSLYITSKQQTSFFVGERCHFYQANRIEISSEQKLAISMEYLLFQIIIPNLLLLVNKIPGNNQRCKIQTQKIIVIISSLLHQQFIKRFQNMKKVKNPNGQMVNKKLIIQYIENGQFRNDIKISSNIGDNNQILEGLVAQEQLQQFENIKPIWKSQMDTLFEKILYNTELLINF